MLSLLGPRPVYRKNGSFYKASQPTTLKQNPSCFSKYLFIAVQNPRHLTVAEEDLAAHEAMGLVARDLLEAFQQRIVNLAGAKLVDELTVVNRLDLAVLADLARDGPGVDVLSLGAGGGSRVLGGGRHNGGLG